MSSAAARSLRVRKGANAIMLALAAISTVVVVAPLFYVVYYVAREGLKALNLAFFTNTPQPVGVPGAGMANAIVGTLILIALAVVIGVPLGIAGGVYVSEFANERFGLVVRFCADVLNGLPSIVAGMFVYGLVVVRMQRFSALAGGMALAIILLPVVLRTSDEVLRTVPRSYREAALALGATQPRVIWDIVLRSAKPGILSAVLLGVARVAGETAPLLFTSFNNTFWSTRLDQPISSLTVQVFNYAIAPYDEWHAQAWAGALTLLVIVTVLSVLARFWTRTGAAGGRA